MEGRQVATVIQLNWHCQQPLGGDCLMSGLAIIELITTGHFLTPWYSPITTLGCTATTVGFFVSTKLWPGVVVHTPSTRESRVQIQPGQHSESEVHLSSKRGKKNKFWLCELYLYSVCFTNHSLTPHRALEFISKNYPGYLLF